MGTAREGRIKEIKEGSISGSVKCTACSGVPIRAGHGGGFVSGFVLVQKGNAPGEPEGGRPTEAIKDENWSLSVATGRSLE